MRHPLPDVRLDRASSRAEHLRALRERHGKIPDAARAGAGGTLLLGPYLACLYSAVDWQEEYSPSLVARWYRAARKDATAPRRVTSLWRAGGPKAVREVLCDNVSGPFGVFHLSVAEDLLGLTDTGLHLRSPTATAVERGFVAAGVDASARLLVRRPHALSSDGTLLAPPYVKCLYEAVERLHLAAPLDDLRNLLAYYLPVVERGLVSEAAIAFALGADLTAANTMIEVAQCPS